MPFRGLEVEGGEFDIRIELVADEVVEEMII